MSEPRGTPEASMEEILASIRRIISEDGSPPAPQSVAPQRPAPQAPARPPAAPMLASPPLATSPPASTPPVASPPVAPSPPPSPARKPSPPNIPSGPTSAWGILGARPAANGDELVLTQMLAEDGSVVALDRPAAAVAAANTAFIEPSNPQSLDVLLLTDALPPSLSEAMVLGPPAQSPAAPRAPMTPPPIPPAPGGNDSVGLASPEVPVQSSAVLSQLARNRARDGGPTVEELVRQSLEPKIQEWLNANLKDIVERLVQQEIERISRRAE